MNDKSLAFKVLTGTTLGALIIYVWMKKRQKSPKGNWKKVGEISNLYIYPLKSSRRISLKEAETTEKGLKEIRSDDKLPLRDRVFVVFRPDTKEVITGRTYHNFLGITVTSVSNDSVKFSFNGTEPLIIKVPVASKNTEVKLWNEEKIPTTDCGDEASSWISKVLEVENEVRLGYWTELNTHSRELLKYNKIMADFYNIGLKDMGAYSDMSSFLLINNSSVEDLNNRLPLGSTPVTHKNFRPNIFITGPKAYEEDNFKWLKIGENAIFRLVSRCSRCSFTTINPETMIKDKTMEPLKTLKNYRLATDEDEKKITKTSPFMGVNMSCYQLGKIVVGDNVYVSD